MRKALFFICTGLMLLAGCGSSGTMPILTSATLNPAEALQNSGGGFLTVNVSGYAIDADGDMGAVIVCNVDCSRACLNAGPVYEMPHGGVFQGAIAVTTDCPADTYEGTAHVLDSGGFVSNLVPVTFTITSP